MICPCQFSKVLSMTCNITLRGVLRKQDFDGLNREAEKYALLVSSFSSQENLRLFCICKAIKS